VEAVKSRRKKPRRKRNKFGAIRGRFCDKLESGAPGFKTQVEITNQIKRKEKNDP